MSNGRARSSEHQMVAMYGPPVHRFPRKRVCQENGCSTVLSIYNSSVVCSVHERPGRWFIKHDV